MDTKHEVGIQLNYLKYQSKDQFRLNRTYDLY